VNLGQLLRRVAVTRRPTRALAGAVALAILAALALSAVPQPASSQEGCGDPSPVPNRLLVRMSIEASPESIALMKDVNGAGSEALFAPPDLWVAELPAGLTVEEAIALYEASPGVENAEADSRMEIEDGPAEEDCAETGASLGVSIADRPDPVFAGGTLAYEATVRNHGPEAAENVELTSAVPRGAAFLSSAFVNGASKGSCPPGEDGVVRCRIGDLGVDAFATLRMEVRPAKPGLLAALVDAGADNALMGVETSASASTRVLEAPKTRFGPCTVTGTAANDLLRGTAGRDVVCGLGGDDTLLGAGGDDAVFGGGGDDTAAGGPGRDGLYGGRGDDTLRARDGVRGNDAARGGSGADRVFADRGDRVTD